MAQGYEVLTVLPGRQYVQGAPVILLSGAVLRDKETGALGLRMKFRSLEEGFLVGLRLNLRGPDGSVREQLVTGFTMQEGQTVSRRVPVSQAGIWEITLVEAYFSNRQDWHNETGEALSPLPKQLPLEQVLRDKALIAQFRRETRPTAAYCPRTCADLWLCTCGEINKQEKSRCVRCGMVWEDLKRVSSREVLEQRSRRYRRNKGIWTRKNRKRRKWSAIVLLGLAVLAGVLMLAGRAENRKLDETLAPYRASAFADFQNMVIQSTGLTEGVKFYAEYTDQRLDGQAFTISATFTSCIGDKYSHLPVTITGILGESTQEMAPGIPYVTDSEGNRLG